MTYFTKEGMMLKVRELLEAKMSKSEKMNQRYSMYMRHDKNRELEDKAVEKAKRSGQFTSHELDLATWNPLMRVKREPKK